MNEKSTEKKIIAATHLVISQYTISFQIFHSFVQVDSADNIPGFNKMSELESCYLPKN